VLFGGSAPAQDTTQAAADAPGYAVIRHDVAIPFALRTITGYRVGEDRSLIIDALGNRFYRAELEPLCARELRWRHAIGVVPDPSGTLYKNNYVIIDGRRCYIYTLDEIADPRPPDQEKAG
jgi:hypothetical protein